MAGHSHYSNIKFRKDRVDAKRARAFAKLSRMITVAARQGGGSIDHNAKLRLAVEKARVLSMSKDVIDRAIKKGAGGGELETYEEFHYEGYGPGGVALVIEVLTDNRHRTAADVRMLLEKYGGNLGANGAVAWMFARRGRFSVDTAPKDGRSVPTVDRLFEIALEVGADDVQTDHEQWVVLCDPVAYASVKAGLDRLDVPLRDAEFARVPTQRVEVADAAVALRLLKLVDALEDHDDVQAVFSNEDFPPSVLETLEA
jgi:YebC/PmpR family DNA-binding regulatory protein